jgi:hypothetical protein
MFLKTPGTGFNPAIRTRTANKKDDITAAYPPLTNIMAEKSTPVRPCLLKASVITPMKPDLFCRSIHRNESKMPPFVVVEKNYRTPFKQTNYRTHLLLPLKIRHLNHSLSLVILRSTDGFVVCICETSIHKRTAAQTTHLLKHSSTQASMIISTQNKKNSRYIDNLA